MRGLELSWQSGTLFGFVAALVIGVLFLVFGGGRFGLLGLIVYIFLALGGVVSFVVYAGGRERSLRAAMAMVALSLGMVFVFKVGLVISLGMLVGSLVLLLRILSRMRSDM